MKKGARAFLGTLICCSAFLICIGLFSRSSESDLSAARALTEYTAELTAEETAERQIEYYGRGALMALDNAEALLFAYDSIAVGVEMSAEKITVFDGTNPLSKEELTTVFTAYRHDRADHFWLGNAYSLSYNARTVLSVSPTYIMSGEALDAARLEFDARTAELLLLVEGVEDEFERELILHDALAARVAYVTDAQNAHNAYGAIVEGEAVCEGYAEALQHLLLSCGIQSFLATGASVNPSTGQSEGHEWNIVRIDGEYYHVDLTWNDQGSTLFHAYFNQPESVFLEDHIIDTPVFGLPTCDSAVASYFSVRGGALDEYSIDEVGRLIKEASFRAHVYISGDVDAFVEWYYANISDIAGAAGVGGSFSYGYSRLGRELILILNPSAVFSGVSLAVESSYSMRYHVRVNDESIFDIGYLAVRFTVGEVQTIIDAYTRCGDDYVFALDGIPFYSVCEEIQAELFLVSDDNSARLLGTKSAYSVEKYCTELLSYYPDDKVLVNLVSDMLHLGRELQSYLQYQTDKLPAEGITISPTEHLPDACDALVLSGNANADCYISGASVEFGASAMIVIDVYSSSFDFVLTVDGVDYSFQTLEYRDGGKYRYVGDLTAALSVDTVRYAELKLGGVVVASLEYSVNSYVYQVTSDETQSDALRSLALAFYRFGKSSDTYYFQKTVLQSLA